MNRKLALVAAVVLVAGAAVALVGPVRRRFAPPPAPTPTAPTSSHAAGMDHAMKSVLVMYKAPPGDTPCETAYNGFKASLDVSTQEHVIPFVLSLQPHDVFIARCSALPAQTQQCLSVTYKAQHQAECDRARPSREQFASIVELRNEERSPAAPPDPAEPAPIGSR